jgi:hypothetical protein
MPAKKAKIGMYNRRLQLIRPITVANDFNEKFTKDVIEFESFPARRIDGDKTEDESSTGNKSASVLSVDWDLRYIPLHKLAIDTTWKLRDLHDKRVYKVVAPATEIGWREGILVKTEFVE